MNEVARSRAAGRRYRLRTEPPDLRRAADVLTARIEEAYPELPNARWVALRLLDGDDRVAEALKTGELGAVAIQRPDRAREPEAVSR